MKKVMMENQLIHKKIHPFILEEKVLKNAMREMKHLIKDAQNTDNNCSLL